MIQLLGETIHRIPPEVEEELEELENLESLESLESIENIKPFINIDIYMEKYDKRSQILYNKTDFNNHLICQLPCIFKCCKCKRNNTVFVPIEIVSQFCLFCGTPNYIKREKHIK